MKSILFSWLVSIVVGLSATAAQSSSPDAHPYTGISERNAFDLESAEPLRPPSPPSEGVNPDEKEAIDLNLHLTGTATIGGTTWAFFMEADPENDGQDRFFKLREGERTGSLQVRGIESQTGKVHILSGDRVLILTVDEDGYQGRESGRPEPAYRKARAPDKSREQSSPENQSSVLERVKKLRQQARHQ